MHFEKKNITWVLLRIDRKHLGDENKHEKTHDIAFLQRIGNSQLKTLEWIPWVKRISNDFGYQTLGFFF